MQVALYAYLKAKAQVPLLCLINWTSTIITVTYLYFEQQSRLIWCLFMIERSGGPEIKYQAIPYEKLKPFFFSIINYFRFLPYLTISTKRVSKSPNEFRVSSSIACRWQYSQTQPFRPPPRRRKRLTEVLA